MSKDDLSYEDLLRIIELIEKGGRFSEFHLKMGEIEIDLSRQIGAAPTPGAPDGPPHGGELNSDVSVVAHASPEAARGVPQFPTGSIVVNSPMVGFFYRAPEPGARPYVEIGSRVTPETTICLIEVMKLINSIPAGAAGVVTHILVENAAPVEFGQALMVIAPAR